MIYIGKYLYDIQGNPKIILEKNEIPDSEFRTQLIHNGLIEQEKIMKLNTQDLYNSYIKYETEIKNNNNMFPHDGQDNLPSAYNEELKISNKIDKKGVEVETESKLLKFLNASKYMKNEEKNDNEHPFQNQPEKTSLNNENKKPPTLNNYLKA